MPRFHLAKSASRGMTLVETLVVMAILGVVMMAVFSLIIPTQRSTVVQTQAAESQSNVELALDRMSRDLLTAGFLLPSGIQPIVNRTASGLTIQTRLVSDGFGRVISNASVGAAGTVRVTLSHPEMLDHFPVGSFVRLLNGVSATEINEPAIADPSQRVYTVRAKPSATSIEIEDPAGNLQPAHVFKETVVVRVKNSDTSPVQTIQYRVNNGALERIVNGETQYLARNIDAIGFDYRLTTSGTPKVKWIGITLTGKTRVLREGIGTDKPRTVRTSVALRNVS